MRIVALNNFGPDSDKKLMLLPIWNVLVLIDECLNFLDGFSNKCIARSCFHQTVGVLILPQAGTTTSLLITISREPTGGEPISLCLLIRRNSH